MIRGSFVQWRKRAINFKMGLLEHKFQQSLLTPVPRKSRTTKWTRSEIFVNKHRMPTRFSCRSWASCNISPIIHMTQTEFDHFYRNLESLLNSFYPKCTITITSGPGSNRAAMFVFSRKSLQYAALGTGCTLTAVPRSTQPSTLRRTVNEYQPHG